MVFGRHTFGTIQQLVLNSSTSADIRNNMLPGTTGLALHLKARLHSCRRSLDRLFMSMY